MSRPCCQSWRAFRRHHGVVRLACELVSRGEDSRGARFRFSPNLVPGCDIRQGRESDTCQQELPSDRQSDPPRRFDVDDMRRQQIEHEMY
jgi:hypothetical protein